MSRTARQLVEKQVFPDTVIARTLFDTDQASSQVYHICDQYEATVRNTDKNFDLVDEMCCFGISIDR